MKDELREQKQRTIEDERYVDQCIHKWSPFMEGMPTATSSQRHTRRALAMLYENQATYLRKLQESTASTNVGSFTKQAFAMLRQSFPNSIAPEIVSVQPMTAPVGAVFWMDYKLSSTKAPTTAGDVTPDTFNRDYTSEFVNGEILATGNGTDYGGAGAALAVNFVWYPVRPLNSTSGFSVVIKEVNATTGAAVQTATDNGAGSFTGNVSAGALDYTTGALTAFKFTAAVTNLNPIKAYYTYNAEANTMRPTLSLNVRSQVVEARSRHLKALWSEEAAEDLQALHNISAEGELTTTAANEMTHEIDRSIIQQLVANSTGTTGSFDRVPPSAIAEIDHLRGILTQLSLVSNTIHKKTLKAPANFIVTSCEVSALLTQLTTHADYRAAFVSATDNPFGPADAPRPLVRQGQYGVYKVGTLMNKWTLYEDPHFTRDLMLIGLKGESYMDAGFAWAPYVALTMTQTFLDPNDGQLRKGLRTRYGQALLRSTFYGQLRVNNL